VIGFLREMAEGSFPKQLGLLSFSRVSITKFGKCCTPPSLEVIFMGFDSFRKPQVVIFLTICEANLIFPAPDILYVK